MEIYFEIFSQTKVSFFPSHKDYTQDPDVQLLLAFQKGDTASFETLMRKYYARILNFIYRFVNDRELAEDLTQEVFVRIYKSAASYHPRSKFQTWAFTIAKNTALNELRRPQKKDLSLEQSFGEEADQPKIHIEAQAASSPDHNLLQQEKTVLIQKAIEELPENQRLAIILQRYEEFSYEQIAQTMNCSVKAVKSLLNRAKENLKEKLESLLKDFN